MEIRSILVNLDFEYFSSPLAQYAASLARRFDARLTAVAAAPLSPAFIGVESTAATADYFARQQGEIEDKLAWMQQEFASWVDGAAPFEWHALIETPARAVAGLAHRADLIVTASHAPGNHRPYAANLPAMIAAAGRPVLLADAGARSIEPDTILIGWKDAREARRAVADALPLLRRAREVVVATASEGDHFAEADALTGIIGWLDRHGIGARGEELLYGGSAGDTLAGVARRIGADLLVTGACGHGQVREWLLGGATRELLAMPTLNRLMSN